ncbi:hypothetical protein VII00023_08629 [Vibrio ichthyoenteri ATCC 700023]|uniref:Uncharacterized protein n=1 Tax=Vibrio ichthyoenteri ATCC 700023 TaxID=870968 RepID=F9S7P4_9VIBR|nr:efflux RND transporter periplasmic adaptor subunit [Vibrio ichthyoenteri]EGU31062.1 hypothetical protein VII00023_08629 [Vibrio ichthyoenteri ATCC 700023]
MNIFARWLVISTCIFGSGRALAVDLIGHATAEQFQNVVAQVSGVVESPPLQIGEQVTQGQSLLQIDDSDFALDVRTAKAHLVLAKAELTIKNSAYMRYTALLKKNSLSQHELDIALAELQTARANVQLAQIDLEKAQDALQHTRINADISGYIVNRQIEQGSWVEKGTLIYSVASVDQLIVRFLASEYDLHNIAIGQEITLWCEALPGSKITAKIKRIGINLDENLMAYPVEVEIDNHNGAIKPGMSLHATVQTKE